MRVALLGTGLMGAPMGRNLVAAGHELHAWNRTRERAEAIDGATVHDTPAAACAGAEVVVTMLSDGDAVGEAMRDVDLGDAVWAQMSTIGVEATDRVARGAFVDAPVLGSTPAAEQGALTVLASGRWAPCAPVFDAVGTTIDLGARAGMGQRTKLVLNHWVLALTESVAETVLVAERLGVAPERFFEIIEGGAMFAPYAKLKGTNMIERRYEPTFSLKLARKDAQLILEAADLPLAQLMFERLTAALNAGYGDHDFSAVVEALRQ
jgi:3-hydroxyisobutyrate dehydrogenase